MQVGRDIQVLTVALRGAIEGQTVAGRPCTEKARLAYGTVNPAGPDTVEPAITAAAEHPADGEDSRPKHGRTE